MKKKGKKTHAVLIAALASSMLSAVAFAQFTPFGYRMTVPLRAFTQAAPDVYIHKDFTGDSVEAIQIVDEAKKRVAEYFGEAKSAPKIILCDDAGTLSKLGGDHDTATVAIFHVYSYIALSSEYLNVDVAAHELTHAETHQRIFAGKVGSPPLVPVWFDEGLALQNDYRAIYNDNAWEEATGNGKNVVALRTCLVSCQKQRVCSKI